MKNWEMPVVEELNLTETMYGGKVVTDYDSVYFNEAKGQYEATFVPSK